MCGPTCGGASDWRESILFSTGSYGTIGGLNKSGTQSDGTLV
uniref:Auxin response factor n=1 Tax=Rhizophora mucronata TaxID=61149 RepID=A0A2P2MAK6_RHIMU